MWFIVFLHSFNTLYLGKVLAFICMHEVCVCFVKFVPYLLTGIQSGISDWPVWSKRLLENKATQPLNPF